MPEEMGKLRENGIQRAVWKGMHNNKLLMCFYSN